MKKGHILFMLTYIVTFPITTAIIFGGEIPNVLDAIFSYFANLLS